MNTIINLLFGCHHKNLSRPLTTVNLRETSGETYVVCLDCGKRFAYDWKAMRIGREVPLPPPGAVVQSAAPSATSTHHKSV
jgi:hypothetical protein